MPLPKALLCILDANPPNDTPEERSLRAVGFAVATVPWRQIAELQYGWTQLLPVLEDPGVQAWIFCGQAAAFSPNVLSRITRLMLALQRPCPPLLACVTTDDGPEPEFPDFLGEIRVFRHDPTFAARLMAARGKGRPLPQRSFHLTAHVNPLIGSWLEVGPKPGGTWQGCMAGVLDAEVTAFGVGPRGALPQKCALHRPILGIKGNWAGRPFTAGAALNTLNANTACFLRVEGDPTAVFAANYPSEESGDITKCDCLAYLALA